MKSIVRKILEKIGILKLVLGIKRKIFPPVQIPEYSEKRAIILSYKEKYGPEIFLETGTLFGDTIEAVSSNFKKLYSIELSEELAERAKKRFENSKHITIIQGDSGTEIENILKKIEQPILFWLDGHYSGDFYHKDELIKTAKGVLDTPVEKELQLILQSGLPHIILIDDAREFNGRNDYPTIRQLKNSLKQNKFNYQLSVDRDIIRIVPTSDK
jgi:hypothetical protein